jgi:hypothetical protein
MFGGGFSLGAPPTLRGVCMNTTYERRKVISGVSFRRSIYARLLAARERLEESSSAIINRALEDYLARLEAEFAERDAKQPNDSPRGFL